ncbi:MAG: Tm-1-like ATP-binding domain-containing protein [Mycobacteriales bacterium]
MSPHVACFGTLDTKGAEYEFVRDELRHAGCDVILVDTGVLGRPATDADIDRAEVARAGGSTLDALAASGDRADAITAMAAGAARTARVLLAEGRLDAAFGLGGSNGATILAEVAAALPVGVPKVLVSTIAAGETAPYVRGTDLTLIYPVVDIAGLNRVSRPVLENAAAATAGMAHRAARRRTESPPDPHARPIVAASMFGVTTPGVDALRHRLTELGYEVLVFHATGVGGTSMEALIRSGLIAAVADLTTTELADELLGGVCSAGPDRLTAAAQQGIPQIVSVGALDMVNFGPANTVPPAYADRTLYRHNDNVTLMRTNSDECGALGRIIGARLSGASAPVTVFLPTGGVSMLSVPGAPFHDPSADDALFAAIEDSSGPPVQVRRVAADINDQTLAHTMADELHAMVRSAAATARRTERSEAPQHPTDGPEEPHRR